MEKKKILGITTFDDSNINILDKDNSKVYTQKYDKYSIVLSRELIDGTRNPQHGITGFHECGHLYMHKDYYSEIKGQSTLEIDSTRRECNRTQIESYKRNYYSDPQDWIEWQATIFGVTLALNSTSVAIVMNEILKQYGFNDNFIIEDDRDNKKIVYNLIPGELSDIFGISKEAIIYRLRKLKYYKTKSLYEQERSQTTIFDFVK